MAESDPDWLSAIRNVLTDFVLEHGKRKKRENANKHVRKHVENINQSIIYDIEAKLADSA